MKTKIEVQVTGFPNATVYQDNENYYIDLKTGLGESICTKDQFTQEEAISEAINWKME